MLRFPLLLAAGPVVALLLAHPIPVAAQDIDPNRGVLLGVVIDDATGQPLADVRVDLLDERMRVQRRRDTDANGVFRFDRQRPGPFSLRLSRLGYRTTTTPRWSISAGQVLQVEVSMDAEAIVLAPLRVVAMRRIAPSPVLESFRSRAANAPGHFIMREEIEKRRFSRVTDLLATVPGVQLVATGRGTGRVVYMSRTAQGRCPAQVYIDGLLLNRPLPLGGDAGFTIDDAVTPSVVEGIEVYRGTSVIPAEFLSPQAQCGVVAIWTRRGDAGG